VEKLQLWPTFPDKPLIKTYVALWESCRSIAPLQLLFLEIFKCVNIFKSYTILKLGKWNENVHRRRRHLPGARSPPAPITCRSCRRWCTVASGFSQCTRAHPRPLRTLSAPYTAFTKKPHRDRGHAPRARLPTRPARMQPSQLAFLRRARQYPGPSCPVRRSVVPHRRSPCSPCVRASYWAQPSRARPPPTVAATAASSGNTRIHRPLLLFSPPATIPVAGAPPGRQTRRHAGLQRAQPLRPVVGARR
jgi:hypothetical protein